jgi:hypothetical protein
MDDAYKVLEHPVYPVPTREQFLADPDGCAKYIEQRNQTIQAEQADPLRHGYEPGSWRYAREAIGAGTKELLIMGGNRAGKTEFAAKLVHEVLGAGNNKEAWCCQTTDENSITMQQPFVWKYMPPEYTNLKKGQVTNILYSKKNGFSNGAFIYPNGSRCVFKNYAQDIKVIEGGECDLIWCDELVPLGWIQTLRYRLATRGGLLVITFTAIEGWSPSVKEYLQGATSTELVHSNKKDFPSLKGELVPLQQQPIRRNARIVYFHTESNPFAGYRNLVKILDGASREEILTRAYGVPLRSMVSRFPKFNERIHVIPPGKIPLQGSNYHIIDPASGRNWYMLWVRVDVRNRLFVYREWPCEGCYIPGEGEVGPWAEPDGRKHDGKPGTGQTSFGWGLNRYIEEIRRLEDASSEDIVQRWMDSRFGQSPTMHNDQTNTILDELNGLDFPVAPAPYDMIDEGVSLINDLLSYDKRQDVSSENEPHLYISSECRAAIFALKEWTGADGKGGASKDPIDCLRYAAMANLQNVEEMQWVTAGGAY